jgi:hypothetical protein
MIVPRPGAIPQSNELSVKTLRHIMKNRLRPEDSGKPPADGKHDRVGNEIGRQDPCALVVTCTEVTRHVRQRNIGDARVEHFHERSHRDDHGD